MKTWYKEPRLVMSMVIINLIAITWFILILFIDGKPDWSPFILTGISVIAFGMAYLFRNNP
jgi:hypothetical protein